MINQIKKFIKYLLGKTSELGDLDTKDVLLTKTVLDIHRKRTHSKFVLVPLFSLKQIHAIDRDNALQATEKRAAILQEVKSDLIQKKNITRDVLSEHLPSVSGIKVVKQSNASYISYEGNGRLVAMQKVFSPTDGIHVEVEEYYFKNQKKLIRRMQRVRKLNGFTD
jgi:hypothetical protein